MRRALPPHRRGDLLPLGRQPPQAGFSLVETMVGNVILVVAVLAYVVCVLAGHRMNRATQDRALAIETLGRFVERLRADADWASLYARLRPLSSESSGDTALTRIGTDPTLTLHPITSYYADFSVPTTLGTVGFLVQVPSTTVAGVAALRENASAPRYGLPYDLNGNGVIDGNSRNGDYRALPVVVRVRCRRPGQQATEVVLATWLRGER
jgi:Tfp pilus assembly protein PilV